MDKDKKRSFLKRALYYFRVDLTTIQGRLTGGFLSMALISFVLIQGANYQWGLMVENRNMIIEQIQPTKFFTAEVIDNVQESLLSVEKTFLFNDEDFLKEYEKVWLSGVKSNRDSLEKYVLKSSNNNLFVLFAKIDNELSNLRRELNQLKNIYTKRRQIVGIENINQKLQKSLQTDISTIVSDIKKTSVEIINLQDNLEQAADREYAELDSVRIIIVAFEFFAAVAVAATIGSLLILDILRRIRRMRDNLKVLARGDIPEVLPESGDELNTMIKATNELRNNLKVISAFADEVGKGHFDSNILVFDGQGTLGHSLLEMRNSLKFVHEQEQLRAWATAGLAKFSEILRRNSDNIETLCNEVVSETVKYLGINQGGLFVLNKTGKESFLELKGMYAFNKQKSIEKKIRLGEGLLGQSFLEGGIVYIKQIPQDYMQVVSGLGNFQPKSLLIVPLEYNKETIGVMELASFEDFQPHHIEFLRSIAEVTASTIMSVYSNDETRTLLLDMQSKTDSIKKQEEMLLLNTKELTSTQEDLERNLDTAEKELFKLQLIIDHIAESILVYNEKGLVQLANKQAESQFGYDFGELSEVSIRNLLDISSDEIRNNFAVSPTRRGGSTVSLSRDTKEIKGYTKTGLQFATRIQSKAFELGKEKLMVVTLSGSM